MAGTGVPAIFTLRDRSHPRTWWSKKTTCRFI